MIADTYAIMGTRGSLGLLFLLLFFWLQALKILCLRQRYFAVSLYENVSTECNLKFRRLSAFSRATQVVYYALILPVLLSGGLRV